MVSRFCVDMQIKHPDMIFVTIEKSARQVVLEVMQHSNISITREGFLRKYIELCGFTFSKLCYAPIFLIHIFSIK